MECNQYSSTITKNDDIVNSANEKRSSKTLGFFLSLPKPVVAEYSDPTIFKQNVRKTRRHFENSKRQQKKSAILNDNNAVGEYLNIHNDINKKLYLLSKKAKLNTKKSHEILKNQSSTMTFIEIYSPQSNIKQVRHKIPVRQNQSSLCKISKRQEMIRTLRFKELNKKPQLYFPSNKSEKDKKSNSLTPLYHDSSRNSFYPLKNLEFKTMKRTVISSQGAFYDKFYHQEKKGQQFALGITKVSLSPRQAKHVNIDQRDNQAQNSNLYQNRSAQLALKARIKKSEAKEIKNKKKICLSEIRGWDVVADEGLA